MKMARAQNLVLEHRDRGGSSCDRTFQNEKKMELLEVDEQRLESGGGRRYLKTKVTVAGKEKKREKRKERSFLLGQLSIQA